MNYWDNYEDKIFYFVVWNYEPHAGGLAAELKKAIGLDSELVSEKMGDFEVTVDGKKVFPSINSPDFLCPGKF